MPKITKLAEEIQKLREELDELRDENEELREKVEELERYRDDHEKRHEASKRWTENLDDRVEQVENRVDATPTEPTEEREAETFLQQVVSWAEKDAKSHLSPNQQLARKVAKDLGDYVTKTPRGYMLRSKSVRTILTSVLEERPHDQTVTRVMDFLSDFAGDGEVSDTVRNGSRRLYWTKDAVTRYNSAVSGSYHVVGEDQSTATA